jgi:hypothetical protein
MLILKGSDKENDVASILNKGDQHKKGNKNDLQKCTPIQ